MSAELPLAWHTWATLVGLALVVVLLAALLLRRARDGDAEALRRDLVAANERLERELRDEVGRSAMSTRQELGGTLGNFQQALLAQQGDVARTQNEQILSLIHI